MEPGRLGLRLTTPQIGKVLSTCLLLITSTRLVYYYHEACVRFNIGMFVE